MRWSQPISASVKCRFHEQNPSDADADFSRDKNSQREIIVIVFKKSKENTTDCHQSMYCYLLFTKVIVEVDQNKIF